LYPNDKLKGKYRFTILPNQVAEENNYRQVLGDYFIENAEKLYTWRLFDRKY